jgi:hypothetical protein
MPPRATEAVEPAQARGARPDGAGFLHERPRHSGAGTRFDLTVGGDAPPRSWAGRLAYSIHASNIGCRSARRSIGRWLRKGSFPRNPYGWYCARSGGKRLCSAGNGNAPHFSFRLRRLPCPNSISLGGRPHVFYRQGVGCQWARQKVRDLYNSRGASGRPPGFRCESGSSFRRAEGVPTRGGHATSAGIPTTERKGGAGTAQWSASGPTSSSNTSYSLGSTLARQARLTPARYGLAG